MKKRYYTVATFTGLGIVGFLGIRKLIKKRKEVKIKKSCTLKGEYTGEDKNELGI